MSSGNMDYTRWNSADRNGSPPPPCYDSNGKKVPIWEAVEIDICNDEKKPLEKQPSWKSLVSKASSWGSIRSNPMEPRRNWKPVTLRFPILGSIFAVTVAMIIGLEVLSYASIGSNNANGGGLAFAATVDDISVAATASYLYLPTLIAVFYSMMWNWVDLDSKRLEPWFQLSKAEGATAENSILLQYPFDFLAFVPIRASRRKHWAVVISGATMIIITWAIVPLQSAIFSTGTVTRTREIQMVTAGALVPLDTQISALNSQFLNTAYGISWLGQKLPPYTTKEYAILPFLPVDDGTEYSTSDTWSSSSLAYYTNLTCTPAIAKPGDIRGTHIFDNGNGCATQYIDFPGANDNSTSHLVMYIQYFGDPHVDYALQNPNCTTEHSHNFLAIWGNSEQIGNTTYRDFGNITAQFCKPTYHVRAVTATVNATDHAVIGIDYDYNPAVSLPETDFNITNFEYVIGTGVPERPLFGDLPDISIVEQFPRLINYSLAWPVSNMVGYAIAASSGRIEDLSDPVQLHKAFESAHKLLFSMAVSALTTTDGPAADKRIGLRIDQPGAIVFVRSFAIVVEVLLAMVGVLTCVLWIFYQQRQSNMTRDPASISDIMKLVCSSQKLLHDFNDNGTVTTELLEERLQGHRFRLTTFTERGATEMRLEALGREDREATGKSPNSRSGIDCPEQFQTVRPFELTFIAGGLIGVVTITAISTLAFLYDQNIRLNGLIRPSTDPFVLTILENLLPTAFATLIEPFWVILNRLLCILQPFEDLRSGKAKPDATIKAKYTSMPPQLALWRAVRTGHFLLATVCAVAISTNVLAVALSGLFNETVTTIIIPTSRRAIYAPKFDGRPDIRRGTVLYHNIKFYDHFYATLANISGSAPLPPWVDNIFFYLPFDLLNPEQNYDKTLHIDGYAASTRGFGVDVDCKQIFSEGDDDTLLFRPSSNGSNLEFAMTHKLESGGNVNCTSYTSNSKTQFNTGNWTNDVCAFEAIAPMVLSNATFDTLPDNGFCSTVMVAGWARIGPAISKTAQTVASTNASDGRSLETAFMRCVPKFRTAIFNISVDTTGRIITSQRTTEFDTDLEPFGTESDFTRLMSQTSQLISPRTTVSGNWHNNSFATDWINTVLKVKLNSSELVDPTAPLPNIPDTIPHIVDMYKRLAAVMFSFDTTLFAKSATNITMPVSIVNTQTRIFMSPVMFYIATILLGFQFLTAVAYYAKRPRKFLPRMPLTIASVIAYISASHAVQDYDGKYPSVDLSNTRYGYGRFRGIDGKTHVGVEKEPLVVPLKSKNPDVKRRRWPFRRHLSNPTEPKIWI